VSFDVNSACSSFVVDLMVAVDLLMSGRFKSAAIFNPERYSMRMDYGDRRNCILFGDGATAAVITCEDDTSCHDGLEVLDVVTFSEPMKFEAVKMKVGHNFEQEGSVVQKFAISETIRSTSKILERNQLTTSSINYFISHQANLRMLESVVNRMGIKKEAHLYNVDKFGNQGAAGAPSVLSMNWDLFQEGDFIVLTVVGSGLTWGSVLLRKCSSSKLI
jgi:3-oxoacyl-[acyl-carrier-protein] synthase-3